MYTFNEYVHCEYLYNCRMSEYWKEFKYYSHVTKKYVVAPETYENYHKYYQEYVMRYEKQQRDGNQRFSSSAKRVYAKSASTKRRQTERLHNKKLLKGETFDDFVYPEKITEYYYYNDGRAFWY